jgi:hypothetical protein
MEVVMDDMGSRPESKPNPDPTIATNDAVERAMKSERDYVDGKIEMIDERFAGMDKATQLRLQAIDHMPERIDEKVAHLGSLTNVRFEKTDVRFEGIQTQFDERDERAARESRDNKIAVDAAFAAQEKLAVQQNEGNQVAIQKSEKATNETINKNQESSAAANGALSDKIEDQKDRTTRLEDRVSRMEAAGLGRVEQKAEVRDTTRLGLQIVGGLIGIMLFVLTILELVNIIRPNK